MRIIERGKGRPLVVIPGLQGRWEYMQPAIDALAGSFRVITFPLADESTAKAPFDRRRGMDSFADQVEAALDELAIDRAVICGISFGGLVALRFAARCPERVETLIMVSAPGPHWHLKPRHDLYARHPLIFGPVFAAESPFRLTREIARALPQGRARRAFVRTQLGLLARAPVSVRRMAMRARLIGEHDRLGDCRSVSCPTLIVHGDPALDHVVDANGTSSYAGLIRNASVARLDGTGHLGSITRPHEFADIVRGFLSTRQGDHGTAA